MYFDKNASPKFRLSQRASQSQPVVKMSFERWKRSSKRSRISCAIIERQFISFFCVCRTTSEAQGRLLFSTVRVIYERPPRISALFNLNKDATTFAHPSKNFCIFTKSRDWARGRKPNWSRQSSCSRVGMEIEDWTDGIQRRVRSFEITAKKKVERIIYKLM